MKYDVFLSHASEDRDFARQLAEMLRRRKVRTWFDQFMLRLGDSIPQKINDGLRESRFGVIVISRHFLEKAKSHDPNWIRRELGGLLARGKILPIWHGVTSSELERDYPSLVEIVAVSSSEGIEVVAESIIEVVQPDPAFHLDGSEPMGSGSKVGMGLTELRRHELEGEYLVDGTKEDGDNYAGTATISKQNHLFMIVQRIGNKVHRMQGQLDGDMLEAEGDFSVKYRVLSSGRLVGNWGEGGVETLIPINQTAAGGSFEEKASSGRGGSEAS